MKFLALMTILILSISTVFAGEAKVGDKATFNFTANGSVGTLTYELTAFNAATNMFTRTTTTHIGGSSNAYAENIPKNELASTDQIQLVIGMCESSTIGGTLETITVPAGTFQACNIPAETGGSIYVALVPFAVAMVNTADISMELTSYSWGK